MSEQENPVPKTGEVALTPPQNHPAKSDATVHQTPEELMAKAIAPVKAEYLLPPPPTRPRSIGDGIDEDASERKGCDAAATGVVKEKKSKRQLKRERRQVVYILDQVRALENEMLLRIKQQGLDITPRILIVTRLLPDAVGTTCGQRLEKVLDTEYTSILCVPFRTEKGILRKWISRFEVWPYLETYADDVANELAGELQGKPDRIIENYSDGNLVASLLAYKLGYQI